MQECKNALQEDLKAYLDGELPPHYRVAVEKHLASCPSCQAELAALRQLATQLTETLPATAPLPDALRTRILAALPEPPAPRRLPLPFWRRSGPMAAFGGTLAMGCAFWLWLKVPQTTEFAPKKAVQVAAPVQDASPERTTLSRPRPEVKGRALKSENTYAAPASPPAKPATAPTVAKSVASTTEPEAPAKPAALARTPAVAAAKSAETLSAPTRSNAVSKPISRGTQHETLSSSRAARSMMAPPQQESAKKAEVALDSPTIQGPLAASANAPTPVLGAFASKMAVDKAEKKDADLAGAMVRDAVPVPPPATTYTLTIPAGKRAETLEAIRKLTGELSVTLSEEQPDLDLRLAADGRASLLERLKALGKLTETPIVMTKAKREVAKPNPAGRGDAFAGGRSGGGGGAFAGGGLGGSAEFRINKPPLRLTLILKELPPEEPQ